MQPAAPMRWSGTVWLLLLAACEFPTPSAQYACRVTADCESGRVCETGYCVIASDDHEIDAPVSTPHPDASTPSPDADPFTAISMQCSAAGYTAVPTAGASLYRTVTTSATWANAEADCANDVPGATHLVVLSSTAEVAYVETQLGWIGLTDRVTEGTFVNVTNEANDVRPWLPGQPDNGGGDENCAQMKTANGIDDDQCNNTHRYVCECDGKLPVP